MLRLATQKRRLKPKVQELGDDDILEVARADSNSGEHPVARNESPRSEVRVEPRLHEVRAQTASRSGITAFPSYAHEEPTRPFLGRIETWKLPPAPRLPVLRSFVPSQAASPSYVSIDPPTIPSDASVPPVALPAPVVPTPAARKAAAAGATQKIRAALGDVTENTLLIVQGRPSIAWAAGLLAIGMCFGAFLARPGRSESVTAMQAPQETTQDSTAPQINMAVAPTRAPTVSEVAVPILITPAAPTIAAAPPAAIAPVAIVVAPPKAITPKPATHAPSAPAAKAGKKAGDPAPRVATKDVTVADALAREQLKSTLR